MQIIFYAIFYAKNLMNKSKNQNIPYTWMQIIYMVMLCLCLFKRADSNG